MRGPLTRLRVWRTKRRVARDLEQNVIGHLKGGEDTVAHAVARLEAMGLHVTSAYAVGDKIVVDCHRPSDHWDRGDRTR